MSSNISLKHNLMKLTGATLMDITGKAGPVQCLVIPVEMSGLFKGENAVYMDSTAIPLATLKEGKKDTHIIKQAVAKDKFAAMTDEEKKAIPIMGNAIVWGESTGTSSAPKTQAAPPSWL